MCLGALLVLSSSTEALAQVGPPPLFAMGQAARSTPVGDWGDPNYDAQAEIADAMEAAETAAWAAYIANVAAIKAAHPDAVIGTPVITRQTVFTGIPWFWICHRCKVTIVSSVYSGPPIQ